MPFCTKNGQALAKGDITFYYAETLPGNAKGSVENWHGGSMCVWSRCLFNLIMRFKKKKKNYNGSKRPCLGHIYRFLFAASCHPIWVSAKWTSIALVFAWRAASELKAEKNYGCCFVKIECSESDLQSKFQVSLAQEWEMCGEVKNYWKTENFT